MRDLDRGQGFETREMFAPHGVSTGHIRSVLLCLRSRVIEKVSTM